MDPRWKHTFSAIVSGSGLSGKSNFVYRLLKLGEQMINGASERIIYCYGEYQPLFDQMKQDIPNIVFMEGLPYDIEDLINPQYRNLFVLDDLMAELADNKVMTQYFLQRDGIKTIIFIVHILFYQGKEMRTISLNTNYFVLIRSPQDKSQIVNLAKQMFPLENRFLLDAYVDATSRPYSYLVINTRGDIDPAFCLTTNIFPGETQYAYVRRDYKSK